jgi:outer membrane protein OmpA-like peptidoglycan-associated protein
MYEARNAVDIARSRGAEKYAAEIFAKAEGGLKLAENQLARKAQRKEIVTVARQASQEAEDARALTVKRQEEERIEGERLASAAAAKAAAEAKAAREAAEAKRKADEEADRLAELNAAREARIKAENAMREAQIKAEADAFKAKEEAAKADAERARRAAEELRARLLDQFNRVLETRDTPRGLVITMADVLFDTGKYDLRSETREKLARLGGIVLAHEGLNLAVEGHTDSTGSDELNQKLSEQRADTVRSYLIKQGLAESFVTAVGYGKTMPVADNTTAAGRQQNRRVELIVSGEVIGVRIGK